MLLTPTIRYINDRDAQVRKNKDDMELLITMEEYTNQLVRTNYVKNFTWEGVPIIQYPGDLMVLQELIWSVRPQSIVECGIAFGGLTRFLLIMMRLLSFPNVIGVDIDIRDYTRRVLEKRGVSLIQGSSTSLEVVREVGSLINTRTPVLVILDSNHTHAHVLEELKLYSQFVSVGSYIVVFDTAIEFFGHLDVNQDRPWGKGNNPWTAVQEFLETELGRDFVVDNDVETRAGVTAAIGGWLRRVK